MTIKFHKKIYTLKSIRDAAKAYAHLARFEIKAQKPYIHVILKSGADISDAMIRDEFCNYVLSRLKTADA